MKFQYELRIPKDRVAALIGSRGETKRAIESSTNSSLAIDSQEGEIIISGDDALSLYSTRDIITAIGRGFNPEFAFRLLKNDYALDVISLGALAKSKSDLMRLRGRIIGKDGRARELIEQYTETVICVYGKTVSIIGEMQRVSIARRAIESLISGSPHPNVYKWLEKKRREMHRHLVEEENVFK